MFLLWKCEVSFSSWHTKNSSITFPWSHLSKKRCISSIIKIWFWPNSEQSKLFVQIVHSCKTMKDNVQISSTASSWATFNYKKYLERWYHYKFQVNLNRDSHKIVRFGITTNDRVHYINSILKMVQSCVQSN